MSQRRVSYGWVVVGAAAVVIGIGMGALFSLGVFLVPVERAMGWSRGAISSVALLNWISMGVGSFFWGALSDRIGGRGVTLAGGLLLGLGLVLSSQAQALWHLVAAFGVLVGFSVGAFYAPLTATAARWFAARRGLAVALVSSGIGLGILLVPPLARALTSAWDWRVAMLILGDLAWLVIVPAALLIREEPGAAAAPSAASAAHVFRAPQFWAIALTHFACCAAHSGPIFHMVSHAIDQGVPAMAAATALGTSGLFSIAGRIGGGVIADRVGVKPTLLAGLALQALLVAAYLAARETWTFYALGALFGVAYGGVMPLYALVTREYFGDQVMGTAYGAVFLVSALGMGLGSVAGGLVHDRLGAYAWLYIGSALIASTAVLLALTFRRPAGVPAALAEPAPAL